MRVTPKPEALLAADSFRVRMAGGEAQVRGFSRHLERFEGAAAAAGPADPSWLAGSLPPFIARARTEIAGFGEGFPRLELWAGDSGQPRLAVALRALPALTDAIALRTAPEVILAQPSRKGPNISRLGGLNRELGAEAVLCDRAGRILEGATTSVLWWDAQTLCRVESTRRVSSVTEALVLEASHGMGISVASRSVSPAELTRHETWAVNALHGIRPVSTIDGARLPGPDASRLARFRLALDATWEPVLDGAAAALRDD